MSTFAGEFHARSAFSFLRGASLPEQMVDQAASLGYESIAFTDHLGFYGSVRAHKTAEKLRDKGKPHPSVYVGASIQLHGHSIPVICTSQKGYRLLSRKLTDHHLGDPHDRIFDGLIALTGDREGPLYGKLLKNDKAGALASAKELIQLFGQANVYVEINRHLLCDEARLNRQLIDLAAHLKLPIIACNAPLHAEKENSLLADAFTCLRHHTTLDQAGRLLAPNSERHLKSPAEMARLFADLPETLINTHRLKDRIEYTLHHLGYEFPRFWENGRRLEVEEQDQRLHELVEAGAREKNKWNEVFKKQIHHELALISKLGFAGYFLIVHEIMAFARGRGIFCQGRGSAANSAVCYALDITHFNPVENNLLFERFLSEKSDDWPDIDIDFPSGDQRETVIQYVFEKYGPRKAAMTANVIRYRPRSAFREMSKVLSFPPSIADRFSNHGHAWHSEERDDRKEDEGNETEKEKHEEESEFANRISSLIPPSHPRLKALEKLYKAALSMPRHLGQHSGGIIICDEGLDAIVSIQPASMPDRTIVQWDKNDGDDMNIVKVDLLGLGILAAMENMIQISTRREKPIIPSDIDLNDPQVYDLLQKADTIGTFQVESRAQMATLPIMKPAKFYDVAIEVAIIRPGPIVGGLMHPYLNRRRGYEPVDYIVPEGHPAYDAFVDTLSRTKGVPMFQEQMLRMAMIIAGYTGAEADGIRRAVSYTRDDSRIKEEIAKLEARMTEREVSEDIQKRIIQSIQSFALYGFPESHALSFAWLAYASCWLKVHYTAEFYCGLINNQPMGFYSVHTLMQDAQHHGITVLPVSCIHSTDQTDVVDDTTIRLGLHRLKGVRPSIRQRLIAERETAPFASLEDFLLRVRPNAKERRIFAESGALGDLPENPHRRQALWQAELPLHGDLLEGAHATSAVSLAPMTEAEALASDLTTQGASPGPHPMKLWRERPAAKILRAKDLHILPAKIPVTVGGLVICRQRPGTAKGHCFISLEDETGIANLFVKKELYEKNRLLINNEPFLMAEGRLQISEGDQPTVYVLSLAPLPGTDPAHASESHDFH